MICFPAKRYFTLLMCVFLLNGALFNRIGQRIAEESYIKHLFSPLINLFEGSDARDINLKPIKLSKRRLPTQQSSGVQFNLSNSDILNHSNQNKDNLSTPSSEILYLSICRFSLSAAFVAPPIKPPAV